MISLKENSLPSADRIAVLPSDNGIAPSKTRICYKYWKKYNKNEKNHIFKIP